MFYCSWPPLFCLIILWRASPTSHLFTIRPSSKKNSSLANPTFFVFFLPFSFSCFLASLLASLLSLLLSISSFFADLSANRAFSPIVLNIRHLLEEDRTDTSFTSVSSRDRSFFSFFSSLRDLSRSKIWNSQWWVWMCFASERWESVSINGNVMLGNYATSSFPQYHYHAT